MAEAKTEQEPSIEEILESIRQIISDDAPAAPEPGGVLSTPQPEAVTFAPVPQAAAAAVDDFPAVLAAQADDDDDILDLTQKVEAAQPSIVLDLQDAPAAPSPAPRPTAAAADAGAGLLSASTADLSAHALSRLLAGNVAVERELPGRVGNVTLEDMTRELLRPLLKTWLDQNLPGLIERLVAKEIEKISRMAMKP